MTTPSQLAKGRILDPNISFATDPRSHPALVEAFKPYGITGNPLPPTIDASASLTDIGAFVGSIDEMAEGLYGMIPLGLATDSSLPEVVYHTTEFATSEGNVIQLHIYRPESSDQSSEPLPCIVYFHGGGMVTLKTNNPVHQKWTKCLAATGAVAIAVDFRNGWTKEGLNHFPVGLNDCAAAVQWIHSKKEQLKISKIILQGESGGGNLSIATALMAKKEGWIDKIDGVYANVPYISGAYNWPRERMLEELPSLIECDGYFIQSPVMSLMVKILDPEGKHATDPLAWPYYASEEDLKGLPPFCISVNELDPLRDEGIAFYRKLLKAGVKATGRVNLGLSHGAELISRVAVPEICQDALASIKSFTDTL